MSDEDDEELWGAVTRDVEKIQRVRSLVPKDSPEKICAKSKTRTVENSFLKRSKLELPVQNPGVGLDRKTAEKLRKGRISLEGRLDLHGMRQDEAHEALSSFISGAYHAGKRCVLVITGKGAGVDGQRDPLSQGQGILKRRVPEWLGDAPLAAVILKVERARPEHGGDGALYVLLRRQR